MKYFLAIDEGTTSARAIIFDEFANIVSIGRSEIPLIYPHSGWVEQDPFQILNAQHQAIEEALQKSKLSLNQILVAGITNQRETIILWSKTTGKSVYNAIVWQDRRTADLCQTIKQTQSDSLKSLQSKTGLVIDPYFSATKIAWVLKNVPEALQMLKNGELLIGTVDTWLIWNFTKGKKHVTDVSNASRTFLFDIKTLQWDAELLSFFDLPQETLNALPTILPTIADYGILERWNIPIRTAIGDQQAATFGQSCFHKQQIKATYGTGCFLMMNTENQLFDPNLQLLHTVLWKIDNQVTYGLEGAIFSAGASIQWLKDLKLVQDEKELTQLASQLTDNEGVYLVPAFAGLGTPHWDPFARGTLIGLTRSTLHAHLARAALESIAFQANETFSLFQSITNASLNNIQVDGGIAQNDFLMQFQADISQIPVKVPKNHESTAQGVAFLLMLATNTYSSTDHLSPLNPIIKTFYPQKNADWANEKIHKWNDAVQRAKLWAKE